MRSGSSPEEFVARFDGRLAALASAHSLLVMSKWKGADLAALARHQLEPYTNDNPGRVRIDGDPILLPADLATPFGLIMHELGTNAAKHGSLSRKRGGVNLSWSVSTRNKRRLLTVVWKEKGGPAVKPPKAMGFGSALIDNAVPNAKVKREFKSEGFVCTIEFELAEAMEEEPSGQA
jgi:two-component system CheB/CheR fusion protein